MNVKPNVAIILTTYNGEQYIEEQLRSLFNQYGVNVSLYIFDDCSIDSTETIIFNFMKNNSNKIYFKKNKINSGGTGLNIFRNISDISNRYDFYALCDQDDVWMKSKLFNAIRDMKNCNSNLYFSNLLMWNEKIGNIDVIHKNNPFKSKDYLFNGGSAGCTYVFDKILFEKICHTSKKVDFSIINRISHDWIIYLIARHYQFKVFASDELLMKYRIHEDSQYGNLNAKNLSTMLKKYKKLKDGFFEQQVSNAIQFVESKSEDYNILKEFDRSWISRMRILSKYNFALARSYSRFITLFLISTFFYKSNSHK